MTKAWSGDWRGRVLERASRLGFSNVQALFQAHPGVPFGQVFRYLRETETADDIKIAHIQLQAVFFDEAFQNGILRDAIADTFVRKLREHLRAGWNQGKRLRERQATAHSQLELPFYLVNGVSTHDLPFWKTLEELNPPAEWCPEDINDPVVQELFNRVWPLDATLEKESVN